MVRAKFNGGSSFLKLIFFGLILADLLLVQPRFGWPEARNDELPLQITAGRLEVDHARQEIIFRDQVIARYKDLILYAQLLKILYQARAASPGEGKQDSPLEAVGIERINRIEASGQVRLVQEDRVATGELAVYFPQEEKIVLSGNPQLWRGQNSISGQEIIFYIKENRAVVSGQPQKRVEAVLYPATKPGWVGKIGGQSR